MRVKPYFHRLTRIIIIVIFEDNCDQILEAVRQSYLQWLLQLN